MNITVVGLGHHAWGVDVNPRKMDLISRDLSPVLASGPSDWEAGQGGARRIPVGYHVYERSLDNVRLLGVVATPSRHNGEIYPGRPFCR